MGRQTQIVGGPSAEIRAFLEEYAAAWRARDLGRVAEQWDDAAGVTYIAEELGEILTDRRDIVEHLSRTEQRLGTAQVSLGECVVRELDANLVLAVFVCRWEFEWISYSRVSAILRRRDGDWFFVHYMEAPFHMEGSGS